MGKAIDILANEYDDIKNGYTQTADSFKCLFCDKEFEKGLSTGMKINIMKPAVMCGCISRRFMNQFLKLL
jgi:transcription elongation factor Elf1